jgi:septum formation protein
VSAEIEQGTVLAADTITACSGLILGKPADRADARRTLELLSGTRHDVLTAVCVWLLPQRLWLGGLAKATVQMRRLSAEEIEQYLESGQWEGKAGAYAIQEQDPFVSLVDGDFDTVVGLPMKLVARLLQAARALAAAK